ncbi:unnamed protein product [Danaus chrysippus]|uniref:Pyrroline-5-carboxylate reductase n=1 Tax=Danaus chrysippus TaxID=151541 RepID=A0A8J2R2W9_9NEOP|nr:unnamed protein product [Danaus chrysippus]
MSTAIVKGICRNEIRDSLNIWVSGPHKENLEHWKQYGANVITSNGEVICNCDIVFIGVKPAMLEAAICNCYLPTKNPKNILFISMLAGVNIQKLKQVLKQLPFDSNVIRIFPNTPMSVGAGSCLYAVDENVTQEQCATLEKLLAGCGMCEKVSEPLMDSLGILTGCGPAFMYMIIEALADGAVKQGVPRAMALRHASQMMAGSATMVLQSNKHPGLLKDEVCSPGGCTIAGVAALENGKLRATMINAIEAATLRVKEMSKN